MRRLTLAGWAAPSGAEVVPPGSSGAPAAGSPRTKVSPSRCSGGRGSGGGSTTAVRPRLLTPPQLPLLLPLLPRGVMAAYN